VGPVKSAKVAFDERGAPRGYGYVTFERDSDVRVAIDVLNNFELPGTAARLDVKPFVPKTVRAKA
jgi:RNA recognition motif-containing protein